MGKDDVDVIELQSLQARAKSFDNVLSRKTQIVDAVEVVDAKVAPKEFGRHNIVFAGYI